MRDLRHVFLVTTWLVDEMQVDMRGDYVAHVSTWRSEGGGVHTCTVDV